jgi:hypothetical protein
VSGSHHLSALARLVARPDELASDAWGRRALLSRAAELPLPFDDLFSHAAVDDLVSLHGLRTPFLRVARAGSTLPDRDFTAGGGVGAAIGDQVSDDRLLRLFAEGSTLVLQALHRTHPPVLRFAQRLSAELGHPVQVNAYVTPPQNQGFSDHYDVHDVFVLQIHGSKRWVVHDPVHEAPLRDQPWTDRRADVGAAAKEPARIDTVLEPGDCLYLPRGYLHAATALGEISTHLTIGVHTWNRHMLASELMSAALSDLADDPEVRASLPLGVDVSDPEDMRTHADLVRQRLLDALQRVDGDRLGATMRGRHLRAQRAAPVRPLAQMEAAEGLRDDTLLVLREHLQARLETGADGAALRSRAGDLTLNAEEVAPVRSLLDVGRVQVHELGPEGPRLARRLLLHGIVVV